jgi:hypothetical protein
VWVAYAGGGWDRGGGLRWGGRVLGGSNGEYRNIIVIFYSINLNYLYRARIGSLFLFPLGVLIFILIVTKTS